MQNFSEQKLINFNAIISVFRARALFDYFLDQFYLDILKVAACLSLLLRFEISAVSLPIKNVLSCPHSSRPLHKPQLLLSNPSIFTTSLNISPLK